MNLKCDYIHTSGSLSWISLAKHRFYGMILSVVCPSVCLSVCPSINFTIFYFFSRTTEPISTKLGTKGILVYSNEGPNPHPRGDNRKGKINWQNFKIFFSRSTLPISKILRICDWPFQFSNLFICAKWMCLLIENVSQESNVAWVSCLIKFCCSFSFSYQRTGV